MTQEILEHNQQARADEQGEVKLAQAAAAGSAGQTTPDPAGADDSDQPSAATADRLVPVAEAIKHRRRAQLAEAKLRQLEQQLKDVQTQLEGRLEQLATAEAQRDELDQQVQLQHTRHQAERLLSESGVADIEAAMTLLEKRVQLGEPVGGETLRQTVEALILDKPYLLASPRGGASKTASARLAGAGLGSMLTQAAARAAHSGSRRDIAEYLRLRRQRNQSR